MQSTSNHITTLDPSHPGPGGGPLRCHQDGGWRLHDWTVGCPDGRPQRPLTLLGYRLRDIAYLQLRIAIDRADSGVCQMFVEQADDRIYVSAHACRRDKRRRKVYETTDAGFCIGLDAPLGARPVVDIDSGRELPWLHVREGSCEPWLYVPRPVGELWPHDGLQKLGLEEVEMLAMQVPHQRGLWPVEQRLTRAVTAWHGAQDFDAPTRRRYDDDLDIPF